MGVRPCQQLGHGMFIRRDGKALRCPGDDVSVQGDLKSRSLAEIWAGCPPKSGKTIPEGFFEKVLGGLKEALNPPLPG